MSAWCVGGFLRGRHRGVPRGLRGRGRTRGIGGRRCGVRSVDIFSNTLPFATIFFADLFFAEPSAEVVIRCACIVLGTRTPIVLSCDRRTPGWHHTWCIRRGIGRWRTRLTTVPITSVFGFIFAFILFFAVVPVLVIYFIAVFIASRAITIRFFIAVTCVIT
jgi:hypothetical protein